MTRRNFHLSLLFVGKDVAHFSGATFCAVLHLASAANILLDQNCVTLPNTLAYSPLAIITTLKALQHSLQVYNLFHLIRVQVHQVFSLLDKVKES